MAVGKVTVETGSRLHFGLLSFGNAVGRQYGGVGAMIDGEGIRLSVTPARELTMAGPLADRVAKLVTHYVRATGMPEAPGCHIEVESAPRHHVGLGTGTQLGLAVGTALDALLGVPRREIKDLAATVGRGNRSAVGAHGFMQGGLIYEEGKLSGEALSPLTGRLALPSDWRFVLFCAADQEGLSGGSERESFAKLPPVSAEMTSRLRSEITSQMLPAAETGDIDAFGESVFRYGCLAGECFAAGQGGLYASTAAEKLVQSLRTCGVRGVGQSSWGPTIFALVADEHQAQSLVKELSSNSSHTHGTTSVVSVRNVGASLQIDEVAPTSANP